MKILVLDTNALVKLFVDEKGHDILMWLFNSGESVINFSVMLMTSVLVKDEFPRALESKVRRNELSQPNARAIQERCNGYFKAHGRLHLFDEKPPRLNKRPNVSSVTLLRKHGLHIRNST